MRRYLARKSLLNIRMLCVILISTAMLYFELFYAEGFGNGDFSQADGVGILLTVFALSQYIIFAGMFPGLPYGFSLLEERNSGFLKFVLGRMSPEKYIAYKMFFAGLSGGVSTLIPFICLVVPIKMIAGEVCTGPQSMISGYMWETVAEYGGGNLVFLCRGTLLFLFGILWAELTLFISILIHNRYMAFALPFIIFQLCWMLFPVRELNPVYLIRADFENSMSPGWPFGVFILYIVIVITAVVVVFKRQVKYERL